MHSTTGTAFCRPSRISTRAGAELECMRRCAPYPKRATDVPTNIRRNGGQSRASAPSDRGRGAGRGRRSQFRAGVRRTHDTTSLRSIASPGGSQRSLWVPARAWLRARRRRRTCSRARCCRSCCRCRRTPGCTRTRICTATSGRPVPWSRSTDAARSRPRRLSWHGADLVGTAIEATSSCGGVATRTTPATTSIAGARAT